jgi:thioesterase domain-containing protein
MDKLSEVREFLYRGIPLTRAMGIDVLQASADSVELKAPLKANINHNQTAFGGSIHSVAILTCWLLVTRALADAGLVSEYVVIQGSEIDYKTPVDEDFFAKVKWPKKADHEAFLQTLKKRGRARIELTAHVYTGKGGSEKPAATLTGRFVAQIKRD